MSHRGRTACHPHSHLLSTWRDQHPLLQPPSSFAPLLPISCRFRTSYTFNTSARKSGSEKQNGGPSSRELELERLLSQHGIALPRESVPPEIETRKNIETLPSPRGSRSPSRIVERCAIPTLVSDERTAQPPSPQTASTLLEATLEPTGLEAFMEATTQLEAAAAATQSQQHAAIQLPAPSRMQLPISPTDVNNFPGRPPSHHSLSRSTLTDPERDGGFPYDDGLSSGTLVMAAGRSKYFGPRAGNEWLKDVSVTARVAGRRHVTKLI